MRHALSSSRRLGAAFVVALVAPPLAAAASSVSASPRHHPPRPTVPTLDWQPCGDNFPGFECALATVPLDYDRPFGRTTQLALAKFPAADQAHRIGTLFVNPGGPGGSGVGLVLDAGEFLGAQLDGRFDVVGFDPRGVAASDPLHCFDSEDALNAFVSAVPVFPYRRDQYRPFFDHLKSLGAECLDDHQAVAANMNTADVAR